MKKDEVLMRKLSVWLINEKGKEMEKLQLLPACTPVKHLLRCSEEKLLEQTGLQDAKRSFVSYSWLTFKSWKMCGRHAASWINHKQFKSKLVTHLRLMCRCQVIRRLVPAFIDCCTSDDVFSQQTVTTVNWTGRFTTVLYWNLELKF